MRKIIDKLVYAMHSYNVALANHSKSLMEYYEVLITSYIVVLESFGLIVTYDRRSATQMQYEKLYIRIYPNEISIDTYDVNEEFSKRLETEYI